MNVLGVNPDFVSEIMKEGGPPAVAKKVHFIYFD
jgi:hypothetical protein